MKTQRCSRILGSAGAALLLSAGLLAAAGIPPNLRLKGLRGGELTSGDLSRGAQIVVVWASWSPRCRDIVERVNALNARWSDRARVLTIDFQEDAAKVEEFLRGRSLAAPVYLDGDGAASKALAVTSLPGLVVVRDGEIRYQGRLPDDVDALLGDLLR